MERLTTEILLGRYVTAIKAGVKDATYTPLLCIRITR